MGSLPTQLLLSLLFWAWYHVRPLPLRALLLSCCSFLRGLVLYQWHHALLHTRSCACPLDLLSVRLLCLPVILDHLHTAFHILLARSSFLRSPLLLALQELRLLCHVRSLRLRAPSLSCYSFLRDSVLFLQHHASLHTRSCACPLDLLSVRLLCLPVILDHLHTAFHILLARSSFLRSPLLLALQELRLLCHVRSLRLRAPSLSCYSFLRDSVLFLQHHALLHTRSCARLLGLASVRLLYLQAILDHLHIASHILLARLWFLQPQLGSILLEFLV